MEEKHALRHIFFREFVRELIKNTHPADIEIEKQKLEIGPPQQQFPKPKISKQAMQRPLQHQSLQNQNLRNQKQYSQQNDGMQMSRGPTEKNEANIFPMPEAGKPIKVGKQEGDFGNIMVILKDPGVQSIECPGPNKRLLVRKNGVIHATKITLNKKEIKRIVNDFSEKTRIPLVNGLLKAALGDLIITAVTSDYVGSRFIIQNKRAFPTL